MEFVVTKVKGGVDGLEWFKVNVDLLFLALICQDGASVDNKAVGRYLYTRNAGKLLPDCAILKCFRVSSAWTARATAIRQAVVYARRLLSTEKPWYDSLPCCKASIFAARM